MTKVQYISLLKTLYILIDSDNNVEVAKRHLLSIMPAAERIDFLQQLEKIEQIEDK
jgi:hypothetical protein